MKQLMTRKTRIWLIEVLLVVLSVCLFLVYASGQGRLTLQFLSQFIGYRLSTNITGIEVHSAGHFAGNYAKIILSNRMVKINLANKIMGMIFIRIDVSPNWRGLNMAVIDKKDRYLKNTPSFNTGEDPAESEFFCDFIESVPRGDIVVIAVKNTGVGELTEEAVRALESLGTQLDLRDKHGCSYAAIGVKGAKKGKAIEKLAEKEPVSIKLEQIETLYRN